MTSIEWLWEEIDNLIPYEGIATSQIFNDLLVKAKEMHKRETIKFGYDFYATIEQNEECIITKLPEELYKETFNI
jgi:hypothetical protein